jgi:hypothetical protein
MSRAMELLQAGVDTTVIALWLGHESVETTHIYLEADLAMKEKMLAKTAPHDGHPGVFKPDDSLPQPCQVRKLVNNGSGA